MDTENFAQEVVFGIFGEVLRGLLDMWWFWLPMLVIMGLVHFFRFKIRDEIDETKRAFTYKGSGKCMKCGGSLVRRKGKYGEFYGCSNYPKCRYTKKT